MFKRFLCCLLMLTAAAPVCALDYTDIWYLVPESGWGVNVVQSGNFMFVTLFIYGPDKKPTWYTAQLKLGQSGNFDGQLYATTGSYYAAPWSTQDRSVTQIGTASFQPTNAYNARLVYTVTVPPTLAGTVTKTIQRQTLTAITIGGAYVGGQSGAYSGCTSTVDNAAYTDAYNLQVTQPVSGSSTFQFTYASGLTCTLTGTLAQFGQLYTIPTANYSCSNGLNTIASVSEIKATSLGIEGRIAAPMTGAGCREDATFGGPLH